MTRDAPAWRGFAAHLTLEQVDDEWVGWCLPARDTRPYGGHLVAQSLLLVQYDASPGLVPLTVHTYFLAMGDTRRPIRYRRQRLRSGRSFEHWCVDVLQDDRHLCRITVVLHRPEGGPTYAAQPRRPLPPESLRDITADAPEGTTVALREGLEIRRGAQWNAGDAGLPFQDVWIRSAEPLEPGMDEVVLAWCSDLELAPTVDLPYQEGVAGRTGASLEHSIRFHAPFSAARWWLLEQDGEALSQARGLAIGRAFSGEGELVATIVQHTLLRLSFEDSS